MRRALAILAIALGVLLGLVGAAVAIVVGPDDTVTMDIGRLTAPSPSTAIVSAPGVIGWVGPTLHLHVQSLDQHAIFVGVGHAEDVESYLTGSPYESVYGINPAGNSGEQVINSNGTGPLARPAGLGFWVASAGGAGRQDVTWRSTDGDWRIVVMNANARPEVDVRASVGVEVGGTFLVGLGLAAFGLLSAVGCFLRLRRRGSTWPGTSMPAESHAEVL